MRPSLPLLKSMVVAIAGPTAVGKSSIASALCVRAGGEIISVDSVQVYKELDIGAAKPSEEERRAVKHHLVDVTECQNSMSVGQFAPLAKAAVDTVLDCGRLPVLVGGSMLWMDWVVNGIPDAKKSHRDIGIWVERLVGPYEKKGLWDDVVLKVTEDLADNNKRIYRDIPRNNWIRLKRYLEIDFCTQASRLGLDLDSAPLSFHLNDAKGDFFAGTRKPILPSIHAEGCNNSAKEARLYDSRQFFLYCDRETLYRNIDIRSEDMIRRGLVKEVGELLLSRTLRPDNMICKAIGYRQTIEYLCRDNFHPEDVEAFMNYVFSLAMATRNYAKKQLQWYRKTNDFLWINSNQSPDKVISDLERWCAIPRAAYKRAIELQVNHSTLYGDVRNGHRQDFENADKQKLSRDIQHFRFENPYAFDLFEVDARVSTAEEKHILKRYVQKSGFSSSRGSVKDSKGWLSCRKDLKQLVLTADEFSLKLSKVHPDIVTYCRERLSTPAKDY